MCFKSNSLNYLFLPTLWLNYLPLIFTTSNKIYACLHMINIEMMISCDILNHFIPHEICVLYALKQVLAVLKYNYLYQSFAMPMAVLCGQNINNIHIKRVVVAI